MFELVVLLSFFVLCLVVSNVIFIHKNAIAKTAHSSLGDILREKMYENDKLRAEYKLLLQTNEDYLKKLEEFDEFVKKYVKECEDYVKNYNEFYTSTLDDVSSVLNAMDDLMKRHVITDDPDVQNFYRIVQILHDVLIGYINATDRGIGSKKET